MKEKYRIKSKIEYDEMFKSKRFIKNNFFVLYNKESKYNYSRIGIAISNKFGKAYKRNLYKRRLRNIIRINYDKFNKKYDYIILIRQTCDTINYIEMEKNLLDLIQEVK